ncbi:MAG: ferredoxin-type protein NapG [Epsilonproteobacteria bacterium]|nr:MAG: ferredoxin-type protein NapG [Campylobacterota bacterium]
MTNSGKKYSRRESIRKILGSGGLFAIGGIAWAGYVDGATHVDLVLRPPGALDEPDFQKACIKCGICVEVCPYDTLSLAKSGSNIPIGTPYFVPRDIPCYMCTDIPCTVDCPTDALDESLVSMAKKNGTTVLDINQSKMGIAVLNAETCLAFWGIRCDACYRACPLIDEAITLELSRNERTGKHAMLKPKINNEVCTGCGMCEHACITEETSIYILPVGEVKGKVNNQYIKGWEEGDEARIDTTKVYRDTQTNDQSTLDYLNDTESLLEDE